MGQGNSSYFNAVRDEMTRLGKLPGTIFLGQQVGVTDFYGTLDGVPLNKRIELPVAEEMQLGMSIGLALEGYIPVTIFQRVDFLMRAMDQLVNHLDKFHILTNGIYSPHVIVRTTIGTRTPLDPGVQHRQDLTILLKQAVRFPVVKVYTAADVHRAYRMATSIQRPILIIEEQDRYKNGC